ncbi:MAG: L-proline dehydrogenase [Thermoleophilia bacterium]|jgi:proline dehydrogenase|nr:L-proline dehydrogenase [Thermoleophilia bacterium]
MTPPATTTEPRLLDKAIVKSMPMLPRSLVQRISAPYIAGESLDDAIATVRSLAARGMGSTLDVLGEAISRRDEAIATRDAYLAAIEQFATLDEPTALVRNVSVKLTAVGLGIDDRLVHDNVADIAAAMAKVGGFVRIDMEDSPYTDATLELYRALRAEGHDNLGIVVQAYLKRTRADVEQLAAEGARVRVVKGIYVEPDAIAWRDMETINRNYIDLCRILAEAGCHAAYATHDDVLITGCLDLVERMGLSTDLYEFQMLLGVREARRDDLVDQGHPMRVYVPFGAQWYEYSVRRLRENPRIAGHVARETLTGWRRFLGGTRP